MSETYATLQEDAAQFRKNIEALTHEELLDAYGEAFHAFLTSTPLTALNLTAGMHANLIRIEIAARLSGLRGPQPVIEK